jgi:hypothetical protein
MPLTAPSEASIKHNKNGPNLAVFRSTNKSGYHASAAPDQFLKKKYSSSKMRNINRVLFSGSMNSLSKGDLYSNILSSYPVIKRNKRKLHGRNHRKKKSKFSYFLLKFCPLEPIWKLRNNTKSKNSFITFGCTLSLRKRNQDHK